MLVPAQRMSVESPPRTGMHCDEDTFPRCNRLIHPCGEAFGLFFRLGADACAAVRDRAEIAPEKPVHASREVDVLGDAPSAHMQVRFREPEIEVPVAADNDDIAEGRIFAVEQDGSDIARRFAPVAGYHLIQARKLRMGAAFQPEVVIA